MPTAISPESLDKILALQLTVAWAGERQGDPPGLGWWDTSLADAEGGGDFFQRMFPRTHVWAALGAMREAARRTDAMARAQTANADQVITLFHFGFEWDEALQERFEFHKHQAVEPVRDIDQGRTPQQSEPKAIFGKHYAVQATFDRQTFEQYLHGLSKNATYEIAPGGRQIVGPLPSPEDAALCLARALLPLLPNYPLPFYRAPEAR